MLEDGNIRVDDDGIEHHLLYAASFMETMEPDLEGPEFGYRP